jgi:DNA modification methylase
MGSGTTIEAAILENRSWIGIEKNEQDFDIAQNRIDNLLNKF